MQNKKEFVYKIKKYIWQEKNRREITNLVFLCIGTDRVIGDAFGPLVGSELEEKLSKYNISNINIYGTLNENVCYTNIYEVLKKIKDRHPKSCLIAIDSALASKDSIGNIIISPEKMYIGKGLNKKKIEFGDISIKAIVGKDSKMPNHNFYILQNTSLNDIMQLSKTVANYIIEAIKS